MLSRALRGYCVGLAPHCQVAECVDPLSTCRGWHGIATCNASPAERRAPSCFCCLEYSYTSPAILNTNARWALAKARMRIRSAYILLACTACLPHGDRYTALRALAALLPTSGSLDDHNLMVAACSSA